MKIDLKVNSNTLRIIIFLVCFFSFGGMAMFNIINPNNFWLIIAGFVIAVLMFKDVKE